MAEYAPFPAGAEKDLINATFPSGGIDWLRGAAHIHNADVKPLSESASLSASKERPEATATTPLSTIIRGVDL
jgi:hypothetical protein